MRLVGQPSRGREGGPEGGRALIRSARSQRGSPHCWAWGGGFPGGQGRAAALGGGHGDIPSLEPRVGHTGVCGL